jgi:hypothetical protein
VDSRDGGGRRRRERRKLAYTLAHCTLSEFLPRTRSLAAQFYSINKRPNRTGALGSVERGAQRIMHLYYVEKGTSPATRVTRARTEAPARKTGRAARARAREGAPGKDGSIPAFIATCRGAV